MTLARHQILSFLLVFALFGSRESARDGLKAQPLGRVVKGWNDLWEAVGRPSAKRALVREIDLEKQVVFDLPEEVIEMFPNLTSMSLKGNYLVSLPERMGNLHRLKCLDLSDNRISSLPSSVGNLPALRILKLDGNEIGRDLPPNIANLKNLERLNLSRNPLQFLSPTIFTLRGLTSLNLEGTQISHVSPDIENLSDLVALNLSNNPISTLTAGLPENIGKLSKLRHLHLNNCQIKILPKEMGELSKLLTLSLQENMIQTLPPEIGNLKNLTELNLSSNPLNYLPDTIKGLDKPGFVLDLRNTRLHDRGPAGFMGQKDLDKYFREKGKGGKVIFTGYIRKKLNPRF